MEFILYISILIITVTALWVIIAYPKNYLFKGIFVPLLIVVSLSVYFTYNAILGYATKQDPPEIVQYLYHVSNKDTGVIFVLMVGKDKKEPRLYNMEWNEELEKKLSQANKAAQEGVVVYGKLKQSRGGEDNKGEWIWYDMAPAEVWPKDGEDKNMETSQNGIELIKEFEGRRLVAYQDSVGVWTIGYGHTKDVWEDRLIIKSTADRLLAEDLAEFEKYVDNLVDVPLTQNQFDALVAWTFNLGPTNLSESTLLKKLNAGDYDSVPSEMKRWNKAGGEVLEGLIRRREAEAALFNA